MEHYLGSTTTVLIVGACLTSTAGAQTLPWQLFQDDVTNEVCGVVNAGNTELVVLADTGQLVIVASSGQDVTDVLLADTVVNVDGSVVTPSGPAGFIKFDTDADGFGSLFWVDLTGRVFDVDGFTGEPLLTDLLPGDFANVPCDAWEFWDGPEPCVVVLDEDRDGVPDGVDDCPDTPFDEVADAGGCSCSQLDDDLDTIDNCHDLCPNTPTVVNVVDTNGCSLITAPPIVIGMCGNFIGAPLMVMLAGLGFVRFSRSRRYRSARR